MSRKILTAGRKRTHTFWNNDMSLTSKRGSILLSNSDVAKDLVESVKKLKKGDKPVSFIVTNKNVINQLIKLEK